jgi:MFS family permease
MQSLLAFLVSPWRAVAVLGVTQILAWGALFYPPVLTLPLIASERGWSIAFAMAGFSAGLLVGGLVAPRVGRLIDHYGGHRIMPLGSLLGSAGLVALVLAQHPLAYLGTWMVLGVAMAASLYDPAFATLGRIFGSAARRPITVLTLAGGFASTVSWPVTHALIEAVGWRGAYLVYAVLLAVVAAPLHAFGLPRGRGQTDAPQPLDGRLPPRPPAPPHGRVFILVAAGFAAYAFVPSGLSAHLLAIFQRAGLDAGSAVAIGMLFGPAQVTARIGELILARDLHPLLVARFAVALMAAAFALLGMLGFSLATAALFATMFGAANGLVTIARGTVPLAMFGSAGYGHVVGRIAAPSLIAQAVAPLVLALVIEHASDAAALALAAGLAILSLACFLTIRRPAA